MHTLSIVVCFTISTRFMVHNHWILTSFTWLHKREQLCYETEYSVVTKASFFIFSTVPYIYSLTFMFTIVGFVVQLLNCLTEPNANKISHMYNFILQFLVFINVGNLISYTDLRKCEHSLNTKRIKIKFNIKFHFNCG